MRLSCKPDTRRSQCRSIPHRHKPARHTITHDFRNPADIEGAYRQPCRHRLQNPERMIVGKGWVYEDIRRSPNDVKMCLIKVWKPQQVTLTPHGFAADEHSQSMWNRLLYPVPYHVPQTSAFELGCLSSMGEA